MKRRIFAILLTAVLLLSMFGCAPKLDTEKEISVMVLNGTTGFGMAKLMEDNANDTATLNYKFSVETDASAITGALINGTTHIAALPTNAASVVYNKTEGKVKVVTINTLGVLYLLEKGNTITSFADLKGKTVYVPSKGSNPEYIMNYLCEKNGLVVGKDITLDFSYNAPAELRTAVAMGKVDYAVLPEPMVTIAKTANSALNVALDLTKEWDKVSAPGSLVQGCIVATKDFVENNPKELAKFLEEYEASVKYTTESPKEAGGFISKHGIFEKAPIATKAIPNCNICFVKGEQMKKALSAFYQVLFDANPAAIGGKIPADDHYYIG